MKILNKTKSELSKFIEESLNSKAFNLLTVLESTKELNDIIGRDDTQDLLSNTPENKIKELQKRGVGLSEIAVLYRANFQSRALEESFLSKNMPYHILGTRFFERKEIKDTLAYLRASLNRDSLSDIKRIINTPARGVGKVTLTKLFAGLFSELPAGMQIKINKFYITTSFIYYGIVFIILKRFVRSFFCYI